MERVEKEIIEAKKQADIVLVSFHGHETDGEDTTVPSMFLETFSRRCVDAGADAVIGHGPHELRGIEIYHGAPSTVWEISFLRQKLWKSSLTMHT